MTEMNASEKFLDSCPSGRPPFGREKREEFKKLSEPLISWFRENYHPHATIIIDWDSVRITENSMGVALAPDHGDGKCNICFAEDVPYEVRKKLDENGDW